MAASGGHWKGGSFTPSGGKRSVDRFGNAVQYTDDEQREVTKLTSKLERLTSKRQGLLRNEATLSSSAALKQNQSQIQRVLSQMDRISFSANLRVVR